MVDDLADDQMEVPYLPTVNPFLWEVGHGIWFQEYWVLRHALGGEPLIDDPDHLYDSTYVGHEQPIYRVAFTNDGKHVYSTGADNNVRLCNSAPSLEREMSEKGKDPKPVAVIGRLSRPVYAMDVGAGMVFSGSSDRSVRQHRVDDRAQVRHVRSYGGHTDSVYEIRYHAGTKRLASGSYNGEVRIFDAETGRLISTFVAAPGYRSATRTTQRRLSF